MKGHAVYVVSAVSLYREERKILKNKQLLNPPKEYVNK